MITSKQPVSYISGTRFVNRSKPAQKKPKDPFDSDSSEEDPSPTVVHLENMLSVLEVLRQDYMGVREPRYLTQLKSRKTKPASEVQPPLSEKTSPLYKNSTTSFGAQESDDCKAELLESIKAKPNPFRSQKQSLSPKKLSPRASQQSITSFTR